MINQKSFRNDIHTLRALAVVSVLLYHAEITLFDKKLVSGGFLGVDIFFVISGYLITGIIVSNYKNNNFSFIQFYERRIRRIFPSLFLLLFTVSVFSFFLMNDKQYHENSNAVISVIFFVSNFFFLFQDSYTSVESQFKPLLHTWSLGVEEQFYIFFPALLILIFKIRLNIKIFLFLILSFSLISCLILNNYFPEENFFLSTSRFWEILLGCLMFFYNKNFLLNGEKYLSLLLWLLLLFCLVYFDNKSNHPGIPNVIVVFITSTIIFLKNDNYILFKSKILKFFGDISYTLYLFHLPFFSYGRIYFGELTIVKTSLLLILSIFFSALIYHFYELKLKKAKRTYLFLTLILLSSILITFSIVNFQNFKNKEYIKIDNKNFHIKTEKEKRWSYLTENCNNLGWENCYRPQEGKTNILVIGDSFAPDTINILRSIIDYNKDYYFILDTLGGCQPHLDITSVKKDSIVNLQECVELNKKRFDPKFYKNIDIIAIHNYYTYFTPKDLKGYLNFLKSINKKKIIITGNYLTLEKDFTEIMREYNQDTRYNYQAYITHKLNFENQLKDFAENEDVFYLSLKELCSPKCIFFTQNNYPFTWDNFHLSKEFAEFYGKNYSKKKILLNFLQIY